MIKADCLHYYQTHILIDILPIHILTLTQLSTTIVFFNPIDLLIHSLLLRMECVLKHQDLQSFDLKLNKK